jgi:uncharacterized protein (TIGR00255 family)
MIKSMTGYGRAEGQQYGYRILVEIKAVNHRYAEVVVRMPRDYLLFEDGIKKKVLEHVARGRLDVYVTVEKTTPAKRTIRLDEELAQQMKSAVDSLAERLQMAETITISDLLKQEGIMTVVEEAEDPEQLEGFLIGIVQTAADNLVLMRLREGERLHNEFLARLAKMRQLVEAITARSPLCLEEYKDRLDKRLAEALAGRALVDEARLLTEVALFADRASIDEELVRLSSHFDQFTAILGDEEPVGRKLDFLVQEMNREVNTIGSKANDLHIAQAVVEAKSLLEQIREQIQNVE